MKILFVTAIRNKYIQKSYYPLAFGYLVSYARKHGFEFESVYSENVTAGLLGRVKPDVVALTCSTENYPIACKHAKTTKQFNQKIKVLIGGVHISNAPESLTQNFDVGIIGEGEQTFLELLQNDFEPSEKIHGITYNGIQTENRQLIEQLDNIPHPDRSIYGDVMRAPYIFTARGCPWRCIFCSSSRFWQKVRMHSPKYVAEEISELAAQGVKHVKIYDDTFLLDLKRVERISMLVKDLGLSYSCAARANQISDESLEILQGMNVSNMGLGIESNSAKVLKWMNKGNTPEINQCAVDLMRKHKMPFSASFIVDTPVETKEDVAATMNFIRKNKISYNMNGLMGFPGTPLYDGSTDWGKMKCRDYLPWHLRCKRQLAQIKVIHDLYKRFF